MPGLRTADSRLNYLQLYQDAAIRTDQNLRQGIDGITFPLLGLFGEIGTLVSALKKKQREKNSYAGYSDAVIEEFGDVLWYFSNVACRVSLNLAELAGKAVQRCHLPTDVMNAVFVANRDGNHRTLLDRNVNNYEESVIGLAGKAGMLLNEFKNGSLQRNSDLLCEHLIEVFAAFIQAASYASVSISDVAAKNLRKIESRWPSTREFATLFDSQFPAAEQLPRTIVMQIIELREAHRSWVIQLWNDKEVGSPLTDNKLVEDDYRFHDVFHLAYAAILGWSPCLRALLRVKRKSRAEIDENEDGARAALTEEGVAALIFQHATRLNYFENITTVEYSLLKTIRDFVAGYEVERCPLWQWEKAILDGFDVFRKLRSARRGVVVADLTKRSIVFKSASA